MASKTIYTVKYRRALAGKTDYKTRLKLLLSGTPRLVIRKSLTTISMQVISYTPTGDRVHVTATSRMLAQYGWKAGNKSTSAAYLTGLLTAQHAHQKKITNCIADIGGTTAVKGSVVYAALAGAVDGGLSIPATKTVFPGQDRLLGKHVAAYANKLKTTPERYQRQFAQYLKNGLDPEQLPAHVETVKAKIIGDTHDKARK
ncbi:50S ribosomal protein L18 [Candidatus Woesearchaeota archaeon]|nr:50S ribosomal protein L18 [Candidatus Woesearchaeota archaeon]